MKTIYYLGNLGSNATNEFGRWTAPGLEESTGAPNARELEDHVADAFVKTGCFAYKAAPTEKWSDFSPMTESVLPEPDDK